MKIISIAVNSMYISANNVFLFNYNSKKVDIQNHEQNSSSILLNSVKERDYVSINQGTAIKKLDKYQLSALIQ